MKKINLYITVCIFFLFSLFEFTFLWIIPHKVDLNNFTPYLIKELKNKNNINLDIGNTKFDTFSDFSVNFNIENIKLTSDKQEFLNAQNLNIRIYLLPLLIKRIRIRTISADSLKMFVERSKDGKYNFSNIILDDKCEKYNFKLSKIKFFINSYEFIFNDNFYNNKFKLYGDYFFVNKFKPKKFIDVSFIGKLSVNGKENTSLRLKIKSRLPLQKHIDDPNVKFNILIPDFDLALVSNYVKEYLDKSLVNLSGNTSIDIKSQTLNLKNEISAFIFLNNIKYLRKSDDMSVKILGKNTLKTSFIASDKTINLQNFNVSGDFIHVTADGKLKNFEDVKKIKNDLRIKFNNTSSDAMYWALPSEIYTQTDMIRKAKKYGLFAKINGNVAIKGVGEEPNLFGKVLVSQIYITKPFASYVPKSEFKLDFKGKIVDINSRSFTDVNEYVDVIGNAELYGKQNVDLHITSTKNVDLVYTHQVLVPLHDVLGFEIGPLPDMKFYKGIGNIDLYAKRNIENPYLKGYFQCTNTDVSLNGLDAKLTNSSAKLDFQEEKYHFETLNATENEIPIKIIGNGDWFANFDFNVIGDKFEVKEGFRILQGSSIFEDLKNILNKVNEIKGKVNFKINLKGQVKVFDIKTLKDEIKYSADVDFLNVYLKSDEYATTISRLVGKFNFSQNKLQTTINGIINDGKFNINAISDLKKIEANGNIKNLNMQKFTLAKSLKNSNLFDAKVIAFGDVDFNYHAQVDKLHPEKIDLILNLKPVKTSNISAINLKSGSLKIKNKKLEVNGVSINCLTSSAKLDGKINNIFNKHISPEFFMNINDLEIYDLNKIVYLFNIQKTKNAARINILKSLSGRINGQVSYAKEKLNGNISLKNIIFKNNKISQAIVLGTTDVNIKNNNLEMKPFTFNFYQVPVLLKMNIYQILSDNPKLDIYMTSKITTVFFDEFINNYLSYPIKLKGESSLNISIVGTQKTPELYLSLKVPQHSDISYLGVNLGDIFDDRELYFNGIFQNNQINLKRFEYKKYINTQNNRAKALPVFRVWGNILKTGNMYTYQPLYVKTDNPTSARLFNIIFKKSIIKNGLFDSNLKLTGNASSPNISGKFSASNIEMPSYNTKLHDIDIDFLNSYADLSLRARVYDSDFELTSKFKNSLSYPLEIYNVDILSKFVNLDKIENDLTKVNYSEYSRNNNTDNINDFLANLLSSGLIIKSGSIKANDVIVKGLKAQNLDVGFSLNKNMLLKVDKFIFNLADGLVKGAISYNFKTTEFNADMDAQKVSAAPVIEALFFLKDQMYGNMDGKLKIKTFGRDEEQQLKNLSGNVSFTIAEGKMPKLGSLEYLLRAANILKSGITGLSLNSIIQIVVPMHTGDFSKLQGSFVLANGVAKDIQIYSRGKSLNLYLSGQIDLPSNMANMEVLGKLDKNVKTPLGVVGTASINSLFNLIPGVNLSDIKNDGFIDKFNKIPGIELSTTKKRIFRAIVNGDISSDKFVEKFEWINN